MPAKLTKKALQITANSMRSFSTAPNPNAYPTWGEGTRETPDWLDGRFTYLPRGSMIKIRAKQKERTIELSDIGKALVSVLFQTPHPLTEFPAFDMMMRSLSKRILEGPPVNNKTFRKTWESWLVFHYPDKSL